MVKLDLCSLEVFSGRVISALVGQSVKRATKYIDPKTVITATRVTYKGKIDKRDSTIDVRLKIGAPNYQERIFIKQCKKAGERFPVKRIQLKHINP